MGKSRAVQQLYNSLGTPPDSLDAQSFVVKVINARGNSLYNMRVPTSTKAKLEKLFIVPEEVEQEDVPVAAKKEDDNSEDSEDSESEDEDAKIDMLGTDVVVEMPPKFRNTIFVKRGGYCVISIYQQIVDLETVPELSAYKVHGEISNIVVNEREWQKYPYWPEEYKKQTKGWDISSDEESEEEED